MRMLGKSLNVSEKSIRKMVKAQKVSSEITPKESSPINLNLNDFYRCFSLLDFK